MRGRLYKRSDSPIFYAEFYDAAGRRIRRSTNTADRVEAEAVLGRFERAAGASNPPGHTPQAQGKPGHSIHDALAHWLHYGLLDVADPTRSCYRQRSGHVVRLLGAIEVAELHMDMLHWYITERLGEGAARESIRKEFCVLRLALQLAHERNVPGANPAGRFPRFKARYEPRRRWLRLEECEKLIKQFSPVRRLWLVVAVYTGARLGELERMQWQDIDFRENLVRLRGTKTPRARRIIPLHPALRRILRAHPVRCGEVLEKWHNCRRDLAAACRRLGFERVTPNDLRRTFASWLKQRGVESFRVSKLLGHTTSRMVELVYGHLDGGSLAEAMGELPELSPARRLKRKRLRTSVRDTQKQSAPR